MNKLTLIVNCLVLAVCTGSMMFAAASLSSTCDRIGLHDFACRSAHIVGYPVKLAFE